MKITLEGDYGQRIEVCGERALRLRDIVAFFTAALVVYGYKLSDILKEYLEAATQTEYNIVDKNEDITLFDNLIEERAKQ